MDGVRWLTFIRLTAGASCWWACPAAEALWQIALSWCEKNHVAWECCVLNGRERLLETLSCGRRQIHREGPHCSAATRGIVA
jgi:hypothetical protein